MLDDRARVIHHQAHEPSIGGARESATALPLKKKLPERLAAPSQSETFGRLFEIGPQFRRKEAMDYPGAFLRRGDRAWRYFFFSGGT